MRALTGILLATVLLAGCTGSTPAPTTPTPTGPPAATEQAPVWSVGDAWRYAVTTPNGTGMEERTVTGYEKTVNGWAYVLRISVREPGKNATVDRRMVVDELTLDPLNPDGSRVAEFHFPLRDNTTWQAKTGATTTQHHATFVPNETLPAATGFAKGRAWFVQARLVSCAGATCGARGADVVAVYAPLAANAIERSVKDARGALAYRATLDAMHRRCGPMLSADGTSAPADFLHPHWSTMCGAIERFNLTQDEASKIARGSLEAWRALPEKPPQEIPLRVRVLGAATASGAYGATAEELAQLRERAADDGTSATEGAPLVLMRVATKAAIKSVAALPFVYEIELGGASAPAVA